MKILYTKWFFFSILKHLKTECEPFLFASIFCEVKCYESTAKCSKINNWDLRSTNSLEIRLLFDGGIFIYQDGLYMKCIGINYKKVAIDKREKYSFSCDEQADISEYLKNKGFKGAVVLSTCNRSELYFTYEGNDDDVAMAIDAISCIKKISVDEIMENVYVYSEKKAVSHLFSVAAGLDSMVLGEDEILRQVKESYRFALENGYSENQINMTFQSAFNCAKTIKTETLLSKTPVSYGTLAANAIENFLEKEGGSSVLIVGITGKMGNILAKNLMGKGIERIIGTKRSRIPLFEENTDNSELKRIDIIDFEDRYKYIAEADVIVSVTSSPHFTLVADKVENAIDKKEKKRLFIDMAVPHDIDGRVRDIAGCSYMDIDDFKSAADKNSELKVMEADKAAMMVDEKVNSILEKLAEQASRSVQNTAR